MSDLSNTISQIEKTKISVKSFISVLVGMAAILSAVYFLHLEENLNLVTVVAVAAGGFCIYAFTPFKYRLPLLFGLNIIAIIALLGITGGLLFLVYALLLFGLLNLPFSVRVRTILLVLAGIGLAFARLKYIHLPHGNLLLPVLGGLFMFRSVLFLYEQRYAKKQESLWLRLNYFFMLPNLVFVIFPVVDYKIYINSFYARPAADVYHKGIMWMANGVIHLFVYRIIYYFLVPNPSDIESVYGWLQLIFTSYSLIIRLAGIFHLSAGIICLFGFDIPPTFNNYFLANSFSDLWRRVNMYWRAFVMKVFYYPVYFKIKKIGTIRGIAVSILIAFAFNWFLHAYQWFWVRGSFLFSIQDATFWAVFGITVMLNSVYQAMPKKPKVHHEGFRIFAAAIMTLRIIGIFMFMSLLWSWWTAPSIAAWVGMFGVWETFTFDQAILLTSVLFSVIAFGVLLHYLVYLFEKNNGAEYIKPGYTYAAVVSGVFVLSIIGIPAVSTAIEKNYSIKMQPVIHTMLNDADKETQFKGYYDTMLSGNNNILSSPLNEAEKGKPKNWKQLHTLGALDRTDGLMTKILKPNLNITFKGANLTTNSDGLRDRPTTKEKPFNTIRIALLGSSIEMGSGVTTEETYENLSEDVLTKDSVFAPYEKVEILNFAVPGTQLPQHLARLDQVALDFHPQVVIYTAHSDEVRRIMDNLYRVYTDLPDVEYEYVNNYFDELNIDSIVDEGTFMRAARPKIMDFITWGVSHIKHTCDSIGAIPVWMFVPALDGNYTPEEDQALAELAKGLGYYVISLEGFRGESSEEEIILRPWDSHPSSVGHQMLAKKMCEEIKANKELIKKIVSTYNTQKK